MKYLVEKYTLPRQEEATFLAKTEEQKAKVIKTFKTDDYSIFITINKVVATRERTPILKPRVIWIMWKFSERHLL